MRCADLCEFHISLHLDNRLGVVCPHAARVREPGLLVCWAELMAVCWPEHGRSRRSEEAAAVLLQEGVRAALDRALSRESCVTSETWAQRARPFHFYLCRFHESISKLQLGACLGAKSGAPSGISCLGSF